MTRQRLIVTVLAALLLAVPLRAQVITPNQSITVVDSGTACVTAPAACAIYALDSATGGLTINVSGTWTGTLTFEGTNNNGSWVLLSQTQNVATGAQGSTTTANGLFSITNVGVILVRVRATAAITGTAQITAAKGLGFARAGSGNGAVGSAPRLVAYGRVLAQIAANASIVTYTVGPADGTFELKWDLTITTSTSHSFQLNLAITDENNLANNIVTLDAIHRNGQYATLITNTAGTGEYAGRSLTFRAKAGTTITLSTSGTFTTVTYNAEGLIVQVA